MSEDDLRPEAVVTVAAILQACAVYPEQRVMQVIVNALGPGDHFYVQDKDLRVRLQRYAATGRAGPVSD